MTLLKLTPATSTHRGMRRKQNEDAVGYKYPDDMALLQSHGAMFVVADGVGGLAAGDEASNMAVERLIKRYYQTSADKDPEARLAQSVTGINTDIYEQLNKKGATTLAAIVILGNTIIAASVGDSLIFRVRDGSIEQLNEEDVLDSNDSDDGSLTQAIGYRETIEVQIISGTIASGDKLILCSDGLTRYIKPDEIVRLSNVRDPRDGVRRMINDANTRGGADNISTILINVGEDSAPEDIKNHIARLVVPVSIDSQAMMMMEHEPGKALTKLPTGRREVVEIPVADRPTPVVDRPTPVVDRPTPKVPNTPPKAVRDTRPKPHDKATPKAQSNSNMLIVAGVIVLVVGAVLVAFALGLAGSNSDDTTPSPTESVIATEAPTEDTSAVETDIVEESTPILNGEITLSDYIVLQSSVLTVDRVGDEVGSYIANANVAYLVDNITEFEGQIWYRLLNETTNEMGWVVANDLPDYELRPNSD